MGSGIPTASAIPQTTPVQVLYNFRLSGERTTQTTEPRASVIEMAVNSQGGGVTEGSEPPASCTFFLRFLPLSVAVPSSLCISFAKYNEML